MEFEKEKHKKIISSFKYGFEGILVAFKTERNINIHIIIMFIVIVMGILLKITRAEWIACIILFAMVISGELFNTAIENIVDIIVPHKNEKAKIIKDISAGGVLVLAIGAAIIGLIIFIPKICYMLQ